ncbi:sensor histidine kinase [Blastococcus sp. SYSU D00669]
MTFEGAGRWAAAHPRLVDAGLAVLVVLLALPGLNGHGPDARPPGLPAVGLFLLGAATLVVRREHPLPVWAATTTAGVLAVLVGGLSTVAGAAACLALYSVGRQLSLRTTALAVLVSAAAFVLASVVVEGAWLDDRMDVPGLEALAWGGGAAAVGVAVRSQRAALEAAEARARQAELTREEEAERRVTDERLRIARELHDVVAHSISVINVQAGVARHLMGTRPEQASAALGLVREASRTVLSELSAIVGLLRTPEEDAPTEPAPGLARVDGLVDSARRAGLQLSCTVTGEPGGLPPIHDLTAYRVVQEALTNAAKHGDGTAELAIHHGPEGVSIEVRNPVGAADRAAPGGGHGLIGMRERVEAVRGRLVTGAADGLFTVSALVPRASA